MPHHWHSKCKSASPLEGDVPTYQYACTACGHQLEAVQSFTDDALTECPVCEGRLRKLYSAVGIVFKGSGFYRTDSRNGKSGGGSRETKKETADTSAGSTSSSADSASSSTASTNASSSSSSAGSSGSGSSGAGSSAAASSTAASSSAK
jgi:putative FmdB family regulatory protein